MKTNNTLLLASSSSSRKMLLDESQIPFKVIYQTADESQCDVGLPFQQLVEAIASHKMDHVIMPEGKEGDVAFVLTADTMTEGADGSIQGKPVDRDDAIVKIKAARNGKQRVGTAFVLEKRTKVGSRWKTEKQIKQFVVASHYFCVPDEWIDVYLEKSWGLKASGAIAIEGYGIQFLKEIDGSFSTIVGLPMFELREALQEIGFFDR